MRKYELVLVLIDLEAEAQDKLLGKIKKDLEGLGGQIEKEEEWGKKELAYRIKREKEGIFFFWEISLPPEAVVPFQQKIKLEEKILRYLLVKSDSPPEARQRKPSYAKASKGKGGEKG